MTNTMSLLDELLQGEIPLYALEEMTDSAEEAVKTRREAVEEMTDTSLKNLGAYTIDDERATKRNIENMVGAVQVPVGVAGPLEVEGEFASGEYYVPMATTEGALVASTNRGCSAIRKSGSAKSRVFKNEMTRAPVFRVRDVEHSKETIEWVKNNFERLKEAAEGTTSHGELMFIDPYVAGDNLYLRFGYDTKDAMGMNMATIATDEACAVIEEETGASLVALSGNVCTDKKPAAINFVEGRGRSVSADVRIPRDRVQDVLKTTPEAISEVNSRKSLVGSARAASLGFNSQAANVIAAVFLATGQDAAHVVEGSSTIATMSVRDGDLYASVTIPALAIGTLGGGTELDTQEEALSILGVNGGGDPPGTNAKEFAEVIGGAVLAGELSLHGALASRHLSEAHQKLGRGE
ncbi:MAG: hydroxymethylglutaryl-CoA reductase (NADPH) [Halobacteria archaeon]|nr:hydroxymethylglutaryl-CoA reductase (NADPH) [Halobacteria archaeon]